jgi:hypothetical protein
MLSARLRAGPSGKVVAIIARLFGVTSAAPAPCSARAAMSQGPEPARTASTEARVKTATPVISTRRRPRTSPIRPPSRKSPPEASV